MRIVKNTVVTLAYTIFDQEGDVVDSTTGRQPLIYMHGHDQIVAGVEHALLGQEQGDALEIVLPPSSAYGHRDPAGIMVLPRRSFPDPEIEPGALYRALRPDGSPLVFSVVRVGREQVVVDANHPLAGQTLRVHVEVLAVRPSTYQEREHGHVYPDANLQA